MEHITIYAGLGKTLKRISDGMDFGSNVTLGYTYYLGGKKLDTPLWELPEHYEKVEIPLADLRLGMVFMTEDGQPYTITSFTESGHPIYAEGVVEVEIPEGYWEQFEPQPIEVVEEEPIIEEEKELQVGDEKINGDGMTMRCVSIEDGVPQWIIVNE